MADLSASGQTFDSRQVKIRIRRKKLEIYSMIGSGKKFECDIDDKEADIERLREQIVKMDEAITDKKAELADMIEQAEAQREEEDG